MTCSRGGGGGEANKSRDPIKASQLAAKFKRADSHYVAVLRSLLASASNLLGDAALTDVYGHPCILQATTVQCHNEYGFSVRSGYRGTAGSSAENYPMFRQALLLPPSGWRSAIYCPLYIKFPKNAQQLHTRPKKKWTLQMQYLPKRLIIRDIRRGSHPKSKVAQRIPAAKI
jgi:hypothetical protein